MKIKVVSIIVCLALIVLSLVSCAANNTGIKGEDDLKNRKIGVIESTKSDVFAGKYTDSGCEIIKYPSYIGLEKALEAGEIDCAVVDENLAKTRIKQGAQIEIASEPLGQDTLTFSTVKSKRVYNVMLNKALEALSASGKIYEIVNAYLEDPNYVYDYADSAERSNGSFTVVLDPSQVPYVFAQDESREMPGGIGLALIDAICEHLGCAYTLLPLSGSSLEASLRMGIADFAMGSFDLENGEEGFEELQETMPILTYNHVIVIKK